MYCASYALLYFFLTVFAGVRPGGRFVLGRGNRIFSAALLPVLFFVSVQGSSEHVMRLSQFAEWPTGGPPVPGGNAKFVRNSNYGPQSFYATPPVKVEKDGTATRN